MHNSQNGTSARKSRWLYILVALNFLVWFYGGISKLITYDTYQNNLKNTPLSEYITLLAAWILPFLEILIGVMFLVRELRKLACWMALILGTLFLVYSIRMYTIDPSLPCACGGIFLKMNWIGRVLTTAFFMLVYIGTIILDVRDRIERKPSEFVEKNRLPQRTAINKSGVD